MSAPLEIWSSILYILQQVGMIIAVGAGGIFSILYLLYAKDYDVDEHKAKVAHTVRFISLFGLIIVTLSGIGATYIHIRYAQTDILYAPAFIGKWILIAQLFFLILWHKNMFVRSAIVVGAQTSTWVLLLIIHLIAPETSWLTLFNTYLILFIISFGIWCVLAFLRGGKDLFFSTTPKPLPFPILPTLSAEPVIIPTNEVVVLPPEQVQIQKPEFQVVVTQEPTLKPGTLENLPMIPVPTHTYALEKEFFPYTQLAKDQAEILHPHLTNESTFLNPSDREVASYSYKTAEVTEHLPALRIMPLTEEDLDTQNKGPHIKFG